MGNEIDITAIAAAFLFTLAVGLSILLFLDEIKYPCDNRSVSNEVTTAFGLLVVLGVISLIGLVIM